MRENITTNFGREVEAFCLEHDHKHYIKNDLRKEMEG